jgi:hypothetical protein
LHLYLLWFHTGGKEAIWTAVLGVAILNDSLLRIAMNQYGIKGLEAMT